MQVQVQVTFDRSLLYVEFLAFVSLRIIQPQIKPAMTCDSSRRHSSYFLFPGSSASITLGEESFDSCDTSLQSPQASSCQISCA